MDHGNYEDHQASLIEAIKTRNIEEMKCRIKRKKKSMN